MRGEGVFTVLSRFVASQRKRCEENYRCNMLGNICHSKGGGGGARRTHTGEGKMNEGNEYSAGGFAHKSVSVTAPSLLAKHCASLIKL